MMHRSEDDVGPEAPSTEATIAALERALASAPFVNADRMRQMLRFVVTETLAGRAFRVKERTIAIEALGRATDFDPRHDAVVRVLARRVRNALSEYYEDGGAGESVRIDLPKGRYTPRFVPVEPGVTDLAQGPPTPSTPATTADPTWPIASIAGPLVAVESFDTADPRDLPIPARGVAETLVARLASLPALRVRGPLPVGDGVPASAAHQATPHYVVRGTTELAGADVRVTAWLTETTTGEAVWSRVVDARIAEAHPFAVRDLAADCLAASLADLRGAVHRDAAARRLDADERGPYDLLVAAFAVLDDPERNRLRHAVHGLEVLAAADDAPAIVSSALAIALIEDLVAGHGLFDDGWPRAELLVDRATSADRRCPWTEVARSFLHLHRGHPVSAHRCAAVAATLGPFHPTVLRPAAGVLCALGDDDGARSLLRRCELLDPDGPGNPVVSPTGAPTAATNVSGDPAARAWAARAATLLHPSPRRAHPTARRSDVGLSAARG
ncbi:MAG: hypothetical protein S0880_37815 [Actinomycetota bacterium]|nr:hypothetical protein [Actinomycetota bacterium]